MCRDRGPPRDLSSPCRIKTRLELPRVALLPGPTPVPSRPPRPAEQPRTKSISDASGKHKRESRLCHLEAAAPSRSAGKRGTARRTHFAGAASALRTAARDFSAQTPAAP